MYRLLIWSSLARCGTPTVVECSSFCSAKFVYVFSKTSTGHIFCFGYQNKAYFISIWVRIKFSLQCLLW